MEQKTYDVFISYSRKDYVLDGKIIPGNPISAIIELFDKNGISYWIDIDGIFIGEEFVKEISKAIVNSKMLVFVSSKNSNESEYTCGEIMKAKKEKKQIIPFRIDKCDYNEKFEILLLPLQHVDYFEQRDAALSVLLREVNREKKRIEKIEADSEKQQIVEAARKEIKEKAKEYHSLVGQQDDILRDLYAKNKIIGNIKKQCPVCEKEVQIQSSFCDKCGWQFPSLYSLDGRKTPICDETQLALARAHWHSLDNVVALENDIKRKEKEIEEEKRKNVELREQYEVLEQRQKEIKNAEDWEQTFIVDGVSFKMIRVEGGTFWMGAQKTDPTGLNYDSEAWNDENPVHEVTLSSFYIGEVVVTQALWKAVVGSEPTEYDGWENQYGRGDNYPAYYVRYYDIVNDFIPKLNKLTGKNFRLPTEAEWEYAARDGKKSQGYKYSGSKTIGEVAWYTDNSGGKTHPVKGKEPNELGLYDMSGNVWEWCQDWYGNYDRVSRDNPFGPLKGSRRVLRGGSWGSIAEFCRVSYRRYSDSDYNYIFIGFRLVLPQ